MIVILIGYMASGKSTLGKILAKKLDYKFIDLDDYIEHEERMLVKDIFKSKGELYFRKAETIYLNNIINKENDVVLSVGGGTPCYGNNTDAILQADHVTSFYLKASLNYLVDRLKTKKSKRPLLSHLKTEDELKEFIGKHLFERSPYYDRANHKILIDNKSKKEIIKELLNTLI
jgi:shikimate kinase